VVAYASEPRSCRDPRDKDRGAMWALAQQMFEQFNPTLVLIDGNSRLGDIRSDFVELEGFRQKQGNSGPKLRDVACERHLCIVNALARQTRHAPGPCLVKLEGPSSAKAPKCEYQYTWKPHNGMPHRIDYILMREHLFQWIANFRTDRSFDGTGKRKVAGGQSRAMLYAEKMKGADKRKACHRDLDAMPLPPWSLDVNMHCDCIRARVQDCLQDHFGQDHFTPKMHAMVRDASVCGNYDAIWLPYLLQLKMARGTLDTAGVVVSSQMLFLDGAPAFFNRFATKAEGQEMSILADQLMRTKNDDDPTEQSRIAKRILTIWGRPGKWSSIYPERGDTDGAIITPDQHLCKARLHYFASVEQARAIDPRAHVERYNFTAYGSQPLSEAPSRLSWSRQGLARSFQKGARGKVGAAVELHRAGSSRLFTTYRSILLNSIVAQHHRAFLRSVVIDVHLDLLKHAQCEGISKRSTAMATCTLKASPQSCKLNNMASILPMIDLKAAVCTVARQHIVRGPTDQEDITDIYQKPDIRHWTEPAAQELLARPGLLRSRAWPSATGDIASSLALLINKYGFSLDFDETNFPIGFFGPRARKAKFGIAQTSPAHARHEGLSLDLQIVGSAVNLGAAIDSQRSE
ncbi:unnamed protein product, partial [Prorocentrum cordatum]